MDLAQLAGKRFGPHPFHVGRRAAADFVEATGDDASRWAEAAPPAFMAAALFVAAPDLLAFLFERSVVHVDQTFTWERPLTVGGELTVTGEVTKARERGGAHLVSFEVEAGDDEGTAASGVARFLAGRRPQLSGEERPEPAARDRGSPADGRFSASRADLIRYAAATRDWNPVHWDHDSAVAAGFGGVVVHGLLQAAWALRAATAPTVGDRPLARAKVRFRNPLPAAHPVDVRVERADGRVDVAVAGADALYTTVRVEPADE